MYGVCSLTKWFKDYTFRALLSPKWLTLPLQSTATESAVSNVTPLYPHGRILPCDSQHRRPWSDLPPRASLQIWISLLVSDTIVSKYKVQREKTLQSWTRLSPHCRNTLQCFLGILETELSSLRQQQKKEERRGYLRTSLKSTTLISLRRIPFR